jgi:hypothetical protein
MNRNPNIEAKDGVAAFKLLGENIESFFNEITFLTIGKISIFIGSILAIFNLLFKGWGYKVEKAKGN